MDDPYRIDAVLYEALLKVCDYLDDEKAGYEALPEEARQGHIYQSVQVIVDRLQGLGAAEAAQVVDRLNELYGRE